MAQLITTQARHPKNLTSKSISRVNKLPSIDRKKQDSYPYHLERLPNFHTSLYLDASETGDKTARPFENLVHEQINGRLYQREHPSVTSSTVHYSVAPSGVLHSNEYQTESQNYFSDQNCASFLSNVSSEFGSQYGSSTIHGLYQSSSGTNYQQPTDNQFGQNPTTSTYEAYTSDPFFKSHSCSSLYDKRSLDIINWDRTQPRNLEYYRKPIDNITPSSSLAKPISTYTESFGKYKSQTSNTALRAEQPKYSSSFLNPRWIRTNPIPNDDLTDNPYLTTTADVYKALPIDYLSPRHSSIHGIFSKSISNIMPYNPYNPVHHTSETTNGSLDSRPHLVLRQLPRIKLPPVVRPKPAVEPAAENERKA
ncbi:unnamed protein product [Adineta ricciae]|uniref:Uncharacterized protein n=1 Tax=Adineta ricciae TaxID=249248 RepID=A0A815SSR9_ADIRI|nr:unnamed protein product [Adineta ricciae]